MIPFSHTYLFGTILFLIPWFIIFYLRKDLRREMMVISIFGAVMSVITGYIWLTYDWWHPETITHTRVGFEDLLLGFGNGGVGAVLYQYVHSVKSRITIQPNKTVVIAIVFGLMICMFVFISLLSMTSFYASALCMFLAMGVFYFLRKDLFFIGVRSGIYMTLLSLPVYVACELVSPGWIASAWFTQSLSGIYLWRIPIEDLVFYFQAGYLSPLFYKLWYGESII